MKQKEEQSKTRWKTMTTIQNNKKNKAKQRETTTGTCMPGLGDLRAPTLSLSSSSTWCQK